VGAGSTLLLDEHFGAGDDRFLAELLSSRAEKKLAHFAPGWLADKRPWARRMLIEYIDDGCCRAYHRGLVKRLFKGAEAAGDDELMLHFLVAFDRAIERKAVTRHRWDAGTGRPRKVIAFELVTEAPARQPADKSDRSPEFSLYTRSYLQRRALRYFRQIGFRDQARFLAAVHKALGLYRDEHLARPEQLLDAWGLMHLLYHGSDVLVRHPRAIRVASGRTLAELEPAPLHAGAWKHSELDALFTLLVKAPSLLARRFVRAMIEAHHAPALSGLDMRRVKRLLWSPHEDVQVFGAELLQRATGAESLPVEEWLALLDIENPYALPLVCGLVERTVTPERLSLEQCIALACSRAAPVAELGLGWARGKPVATAEDLAICLRVSAAQAAIVREKAVAWALTHLLKLGSSVHLRELFDSRFADVRALALLTLTSEARFQDDLSLWAALAESPYPDARDHLLRHLDERRDRIDRESIEHVWATALLSVHRGSRSKRLVLQQLGERLQQQPERADRLLPLAAICLRSVREAERRHALGAIALAAFRCPELRQPIARYVPELELGTEPV
jgi:hypothetical protein